MAMTQTRERDTDAVAAPQPAPSATVVAPLGNRATGALLARRPARGVADPRLAPVLARRPLARAPTRDEMVAAFKLELAAAEAGTGTWKDVALRLNGFSRDDIARMVRTMSVEALRSTRAAAERDLAGWPLDHLLVRIDAAALVKGARLRPLSSTVWAAYQPVAYPLPKGDVWDKVGGNVGRGFDGENTCATRVSWALNRGGAPIVESDPGWIYPNKSSEKFDGIPGDDKRYIVSAPYMETYLTGKWGKPDKRFKKGADVAAFEPTLAAGQVAVFAGPHHAGLIRPGYRDPHVFGDGVMPVAVWILP